MLLKVASVASLLSKRVQIAQHDLVQAIWKRAGQVPNARTQCDLSLAFTFAMGSLSVSRRELLSHRAVLIL